MSVCLSEERREVRAGRRRSAAAGCGWSISALDITVEHNTPNAAADGRLELGPVRGARRSAVGLARGDHGSAQLLERHLLALGGVYTNLWQVQAGERACAS